MYFPPDVCPPPLWDGDMDAVVVPMNNELVFDCGSVNKSCSVTRAGPVPNLLYMNDGIVC